MGLMSLLLGGTTSAMAGGEIVTVGRLSGNGSLAKLVTEQPAEGIVLQHFMEYCWDYPDFSLCRRDSRVVFFRDDQFLYFLGIAERDPAYRLIPTTAASAWGDQLRADSFRIELSSTPTIRQPEYEICFNVAPLVVIKNNKLNTATNLPAENVMVRADENTWRLAAKVPFSLIGGLPKENARLGFILHRWLPAGQLSELGEGWGMWSDLGTWEERLGEGFVPYSTMLFAEKVPLIDITELGWQPDKNRTVKGSLRNTLDRPEKLAVLLTDWKGMERGRPALDLRPGERKDFTLKYLAEADHGLSGEVVLRVSDEQNRILYQSPRRRVLRRLQKRWPAPAVSPVGVIPQPQFVEKVDGADFLVKDKASLVFSAGGCEQEKFSAADFAGFLRERFAIETECLEVKSATEKGIILRLAPSQQSGIPLDVAPRNRAQGYTLKTSKDGVVITAETQQGLFYGLQTLKQLGRKTATGWMVPGVSVVDWPDLAIRGIHGPLYGSRCSREEACKMLALFKVNHVIGDSLTAKDARNYFIEVAPHRQFFAWGAPNMAPKEIQEAITEKGGGPDKAMCPVAEGVGPVVRKGLEELAALGVGPYLHVGCDEPNVGLDPRTAKVIQEKGRELLAKRFPNLQNEKAKADLIKALGGQWVCGNYVGNTVLRQAVNLGKTPMAYAETMISDTALSFIQDLKDKVVLEPWNYLPRKEYGAACFLARNGCRVVGLPAIFWHDTLAESHYYHDNVTTFARNIFDLGQEGIMVTQWGGPEMIEARWFGLVYSADYMWSVDRPGTVREFRQHFGEQMFGDPAVGSAFPLVDRVHRETWEPSVGQGTGGAKASPAEMAVWVSQNARRIAAIRYLLGTAPKFNKAVAHAILDQFAEPRLARLEEKIGIPPKSRALGVVTNPATGYQKWSIPVKSVRGKGFRGAPPGGTNLPPDLVTRWTGEIIFDQGANGWVDIAFFPSQMISGVGVLQARNENSGPCALDSVLVQYERGTNLLDCAGQKKYDGNLVPIEKPDAGWTHVMFDTVSTPRIRVNFQLCSNLSCRVYKLALYREPTELWRDYVGCRVSDAHPQFPASNLFDRNDGTVWVPRGNGFEKQELPSYWMEAAYETPRRVTGISFLHNGNHAEPRPSIARTEAYAWNEAQKKYDKVPFLKEPRYRVGPNELLLNPVVTKRIRLVIYPRTDNYIQFSEVEFWMESPTATMVTQEEIARLLN